MARRLFGTDGVRGLAGEFLSAELALALGRAATRQTDAERAQVLIIRDTRESGEMLQAAVAAGLSASHNPYHDNGIKFFAGDGYKLSDEAELAIERELEECPSGQTGAGGEGAGGPASGSTETSPGPAIGRIRELRGAPEDYLRELHTRFVALNLHGLDVLLDCANGATFQVAPEIFRRLGATVSVINDKPDGRNINAGCGSTHVEGLAERVAAGGHSVGFAFDGDG